MLGLDLIHVSKSCPSNKKDSDQNMQNMNKPTKGGVRSLALVNLVRILNMKLLNAFHSLITWTSRVKLHLVWKSENLVYSLIPDKDHYAYK